MVWPGIDVSEPHLPDRESRPHGVVFCGRPGQFSIWECALEGELMDREAAELIGRLAIAAGAADYRIFELEACAEASSRHFVDTAAIGRYRSALVPSAGVPPTRRLAPD
jgi:hypothetical protein